MSDRWGAQAPGFNRQAAEAVFKAVMAMDDGEAQLFGRMVIGTSVQHDLIVHAEQITKALDAHFAERAELARARLGRSAVAKARAGQDNLPELYALAELAKAYDPNEARNARGEWTSGGRSMADYAMIHTDSRKHLHDDVARAMGIPGAGHLNGRDLSHYQQAYHQINDLVARYRGMGEDALLHLQVRDKDGKQREEILPIPARGKDLPVAARLKPDERIESASVSTHPGIGASGAAYDALAALHPAAGALGANAVNHGALNTARLREFGNEANAKPTPQEAYTPSARLFRRLAAGSKLLDDTLGDAAPRKLQMALAAGQHVGTLGPQAQQVIGPFADRTAYRYRGTERTVDSSLQRDMRDDMDAALPGQRHEAMIAGTREKGVWVPSKTLEYFKSLLPKADLNRLHLSSGTVPPSQGVIIDRRGRPVVQAVGYGDDWYLPFNLRNLAKLKGGEYIRTRSWGGPTTEDIYTALVSGARSMTVVSHSGVYTLDFAPDLRGGRRFNDKAARMVGRYGQLLDAVKSEQVTSAGIHPARDAELRQQAARFDPDEEHEDYERELNRLRAHERREPTLSAPQRNEASVEWLRGVAAEHKTADGHEMTPQDLVADLVERKAAANEDTFNRAAAEAGVPPRFNRAQFRSSAASELVSDDPAEAARKVAVALGRERDLDTFLERSRQEYANSLRPMQLNGAGYDNALRALREQFPYYIERVSYHPWPDAVAGKDTGYVKPRHNRPERALAGYFDPDVTGHGKVQAHTIRNQNFPVHRGELRMAPGAKKAAGTKEPERDETRSALSDTDRASLRTKADRELLDHLFALKFHPEAEIRDDGGKKVNESSLAGMSPTDEVKDKNFPPGPLKELFGQPKRELESKLADPAQAGPIRDLMDKVLRLHEQQGDRLLAGLDEAKVRAFRHGGVVEQPDRLPNDPGQVLAGLHKDRDFGGVYSPSRRSGTGEVATAYVSDPRISEAVKAGLLPSRVSESDFTDRLADTADALRREHERQVADLGRGQRVPESERRDLQRRAEALARAAQLHRRYREALDREAVRPTPLPESEPAQVVERHYHGSDDDIRALLEAEAAEAKGRGGDGTRTIEG